MKQIVLCLTLLLPFSAFSQIKCTMPNGVVSTFNLADKCPDGAVKSEKHDATEPMQPKFRGVYREPVPLPARVEPKAPAREPPKKERDIVNEAYAICVLLKMNGATTCDVNVNVFSSSFIDATLPTSPQNAQMACLNIASQTRQPDSPFVGRGWQLKIFSPYGKDRPIAACTL